MFLLDTNVVSTLAPERRQRFPDVELWVRAHVADLYLSAVTIAEIEAGRARLARRGADRRAELIGRWLEATISLFGGRVLSFDLKAAYKAGTLHDKAREAGLEPGFADVAIAATAAANNLTILTRNLKHFVAFGVPLEDPFVTRPEA